MNPEELTAICREAFEQKAWYPIEDDPETQANERRTFCNFATNFIAEKFGYFHFRGLLANEMIDLMNLSPDWAKEDYVTAQKAANDGRLAILGLKEAPHGHVCVVRPGEMGFSGKWNCRVPIVVNIGAKNTWDKTANYIFKEPPKAWVLV